MWYPTCLLEKRISQQITRNHANSCKHTLYHYLEPVCPLKVYYASVNKTPLVSIPTVRPLAPPRAMKHGPKSWLRKENLRQLRQRQAAERLRWPRFGWARNDVMNVILLLMEEILHQLIDSLDSLYHYLLGFQHPRWLQDVFHQQYEVDLNHRSIIEPS